MIRTVLKSATAYAISWTRLDKVARFGLHRHVPFIVCYHRVVERLNASDGFALPAMEISAGMLEKHLDWLARHFHIVSLDELAATLEQPPNSKSLAAVTFDDGYSDIYHHAFPLLKRKGIPAGIFVVTDLVGTTEVPIHERLHALLARTWSWSTSPRNNLANVLRTVDVRFSLRGRLPKTIQDPFSATCFLIGGLPQAEVRRVMNYLDIEQELGGALAQALQPLSWEMLADMRDAGMTIGSHSKSHPFLTNESKQRVQDEAETSRAALKQRLGTEVMCFAYPGGSFNPSVVQAVATAGYRFAFTVCRHRDPQYPLLTIPRKGLWEQSCLDPFGRFSPEIMSCQAAGTFDWASNCGKHAHENNGTPEFPESLLNASL